MFIYLSKKIAIPNNVRLYSLSWNKSQGWIACGGADGLLKVLKLETASEGSATRGVAAPSNLSMNQTLEGHSGNVIVVTWNSDYRKLTTSDESGLIIVWMLHKGLWFEEMINNRNMSVVSDMKWTPDGQKICIVYEDGAVIVGSVDGQREWGETLEYELSLVEWSPDGRNIVFVTKNNEVIFYDSGGRKLNKMKLCFDITSSSTNVVGIHWYDGSQGYISNDQPNFAIGLSDGRVQITRGNSAIDPKLIDTGMNLTHVRWNHNGTVLALSGCSIQNLANGETRESSQVQFYDPNGVFLRTLKVPGNPITAMSWESSGLRVALAVQSFIYFANIRPDYRWGCMGTTLVYAFNKPDKKDHGVMFWDMSTGEKYLKWIKNLIGIQAADENAVLAIKNDSDSMGPESKYMLIIFDSIGSPVETKYISIQPKILHMTKNHVIISDGASVFVWQYKSTASKLSSVENSGFSELRRKEGREKLFHIDEGASTPSIDSGEGKVSTDFDSICCLTASATSLIIARNSGILVRYSLPHIVLENKYSLRCRPQHIALNCNSSRMSIIDLNGVLSFFDMESHTDDGVLRPGGGEHLSYERKDTWDMIWAEDNPELFSVMEKTRMYIMRGLEPEEPVLSSGYLSAFNDLQVKSIMLDEIMVNPENPDKEHILDYETKSLRDARDILKSVGLKDAYTYIDTNTHPRLWKLLAEASLENLDFVMAEKAFVRCSDYQGIQFVKRLRVIHDKMKQRAEIAVYFTRYDEAESIYREIDRKDLAIELRMRLGDWFRVVQLAQSGGGSDELLANAWNKIGDYYAERQKWAKAVQYYDQAKNIPALINAYYLIEDYKNLEALIELIPDGSSLLIDLAAKFHSVGMSESAAAAYLKAGNIKEAIDACVLLNHWQKAVQLAEAHQYPQIEGLLSKYAAHLLQAGDVQGKFQSIELFRKVDKSTEAAKILSDIGREVGKSKVNPVRAKKLFVLAALEVERFKKKTLDVPSTTAGGMTAAMQTAATLASLMTHDAAVAGNRSLDNHWKGAEAYHFFILSQRQLYNGDIEAAMTTALRLIDYEDILDPIEIYSLIAISSYYAKYFNQCSKAFIRLEKLEIPQDELSKFSELALKLFMANRPMDPGGKTIRCVTCSGPIREWESSCEKCGEHVPVCIASGKTIVDNRYYICKCCKHKAIENEIRNLKCCPLCHSPKTR